MNHYLLWITTDGTPGLMIGPGTFADCNAKMLELAKALQEKIIKKHYEKFPESKDTLMPNYSIINEQSSFWQNDLCDPDGYSGFYIITNEEFETFNIDKFFKGELHV